MNYLLQNEEKEASEVPETNMKYKLTLITLIVLCFTLLASTSCCSKRKLQKQYNENLELLNNSIDSLNNQLHYQTVILDSLSTIPPKIDTIVELQYRIIDNTDSLVKTNNTILNTLRNVKADTDTIKYILRNDSSTTNIKHRSPAPYNGDARLKIRRLNIGCQPPFKAGAQPVVQAFYLAGGPVAGQHNLLARVV